MSSNKVERLAALIDDKTMISTLIREGSERVRLIEFKDARADIWHYFRLVQLDGCTLPYAVCIRCMKPVSYKAREGTGGLHRHPCSKLSAALMVCGTGPPRNPRPESPLGKISGNACSSRSDRSPTSNSILPHTSTSPTNFSYNLNLPFFKNNEDLENAVSIIPNDTPLEPDFDRKLIEIACNFLVPLHVINDETFSNLLTGRQTKLTRPEITSRLNYWYSSAKQQVNMLISRQMHVTFVADLWTEEISEKQFLTVWAYSSGPPAEQWKLILVTKDISFVKTIEEIILEVDKVRQEFYGLQKRYVYIFDNKLNLFWDHFNPNHLLCVCHQLYNLMSEAFVGAEVIIDHVNKVQQLCQKNPNFHIAEVVSALEFHNTSWHRLKMITVINDYYDEIRNLLGPSEISIDRKSFHQISSFFSLLITAIQTLNAKDIGPTLPLVALWRAKLEDNCKLMENSDCDLVKIIKTNVSEALRKSQLHHSLYLTAVCLDPRFKKLKMLSPELREQTYGYLKNAILMESAMNKQEQMDKQKTIKIEPEEEKSCDFDFDDEGPQKRLRLCDALPNAFTEYLDCADDDGKDELEIYLSLDVGQVPPLDFWNSEHGHRIPRLRALANRLLSIPAIPNYCQLSPTGQEFCLKRKMILGTHADQILFLHIFNKMHH